MTNPRKINQYNEKSTKDIPIPKTNQPTPRKINEKSSNFMTKSMKHPPIPRNKTTINQPIP
jgi:hypothetical protein